MQVFPPGAEVRVSGLVKAAQHNGKVGKVSTKAAKEEGRIGVVLGGGVVLAVKRENLELVKKPKPKEESPAAAVATAAAAATAASAAPPKPVSGDDDMVLGKERTLERDNSLLAEFHASPDPNVLALYHHYRDSAFDCFNAAEYNTQMLRYYDNSMSVVAVVPRKMADAGCFLVCLVHKKEDANTLCEVAFQAMRQFVGVSMLVKQRCFVCNRPGAPKCACGVACFCPGGCEESGRDDHAKLCKLVKKSAAITCDEEAVQLL